MAICPFEFCLQGLNRDAAHQIIFVLSRRLSIVYPFLSIKHLTKTHYCLQTNEFTILKLAVTILKLAIAVVEALLTPRGCSFDCYFEIDGIHSILKHLIVVELYYTYLPTKTTLIMKGKNPARH